MKTNDYPTIALIGYGSMGHILENVCKSKNIKIAQIYDLDNPLEKDDKLDFDVAIDFSESNAVIPNLKYLASKRKNLVIGTTGWYDQVEKAKKITESNNIGVVWGSNFSMGMQFFFRIVQRAAILMKKLDEFEVGIIEVHHNKKKDAPSGTSQSLAKFFINELFKYDGISNDPSECINDHKKLPITSLRLGDVFGEHIVKIDTPYEVIELKHEAKNRNGFANGALEAARWINKKQGFYNFNDILSSYWV